jgi:hypothetical protein
MDAERFTRLGASLVGAAGDWFDFIPGDSPDSEYGGTYPAADFYRYAVAPERDKFLAFLAVRPFEFLAKQFDEAVGLIYIKGCTIVDACRRVSPPQPHACWQSVDKLDLVNAWHRRELDRNYQEVALAAWSLHGAVCELERKFEAASSELFGISRSTESDTGAPPEADSGGDQSRWPTVSEAAIAFGVDDAAISTAVNRGHLRTNGQTRKDRRIDPVSLIAWELKRAKRQS